MKTVQLHEVSSRNAAVAAADPNHITYTVLDGGLMERAGADGGDYLNLSDVLGGWMAMLDFLLSISVCFLS